MIECFNLPLAELFDSTRQDIMVSCSKQKSKTCFSSPQKHIFYEIWRNKNLLSMSSKALKTWIVSCSENVKKRYFSGLVKAPVILHIAQGVPEGFCKKKFFFQKKIFFGKNMILIKIYIFLQIFESIKLTK